MTTFIEVSGVLVGIEPSVAAGDQDLVRDCLLLTVVPALAGSPATTATVLEAVVTGFTQMGWTASASSALTSTVARHQVPAAFAAPHGPGTVVHDALTAVHHANAGAVAGFDALSACAQDGRQVFVVQATGEGGLTLGLVHVGFRPVVPAAGFPWAALTQPSSMTVHTATLTANPAVLTPALRDQLSARAAASVAAHVHPIP
ncbi:hypothetical protein [Cellulomonas fimi]|uniref:Uncharacterized protein n=1 Tax=Cellulomonas fimi (strain ATCC 484 / DSM 20113 / JCM 1341 / CCUG 24087 / LMG 16345 / NBRC 15513 / NCIMB 8980 / NCTC 7547 / NRS-133) TaxID=590998 RepID=F4H3U1_CELFA|nr:hypothetical protein [Cellulomonas fimi]AEE44165.1 hypothetical protein Celf_0013 [Cellulomonas fimi ATCC 484]NNH07570.1 hypothetical protein [Cellulomonas fimi]VEH25797.1 Uncharacterised protein [Cellulomonas fimi]